MRALIGVWLAAAAPAAFAHAGPAFDAFDVGLSVALAVAALLYARGARALWRAAPSGHGQTLRYAWSFATGWILLVAALLPPLAPLSAETFSGHMLQHEVLMLGAAPLLVLGRPLAIWTWALPPPWRVAVARPLRAQPIAALWRIVSSPVGSTVLHAAALWIWHAPSLFAAAQQSVGLHALQHAAFLFSALLFWNAVLRPSEHTSAQAVLWLFVTMLHTGALGVLLTFSSGLWYPPPAQAAHWGLTPLEDQQLGGLIMWIPGGTLYLIAALTLAARWLAPAASFTDGSRRPTAESRLRSR